MSYNKDTDWDNEEAYLKNLITKRTNGLTDWAQKQLDILSKAKSQFGGSVAPTAPSSTSNPYNENTNVANEKAYLTDLSKNGNPGEQAWANNQMGILNDIISRDVLPPIAETLPTGAYAPTGTYNDADLPAEAQAKIQAFKQAYDEAIAKGDTAAADKAHAGAEAIRAQYGYSGGADGSEKISLVGLGSNDILSWNDIYNTVNPKPTYEEPTVNGNTYSAEIENILGEILSREDFSYNVENDPLYAQYKTMYNREGDRAMRDTLAEAAASAGGMNSYAITAAQQANNYYASQLNDKIPELHQLAYEMYLQDKESKVQDLGLLSQLDETQYNRYRDTMSDYWDDKTFAYGAYTDAVTQGNNERDYLSKDQATARDDVWNLISLGVTPSADLITKAGMSQTDVDLAIAAVKSGITGDNGYTGGNGNTGDNGYKGDTGGIDDGDNTGFTGDTPATAGITDEIKEKCASFTSNTELGNYIDGLVASGAIKPEVGDQLYAQYVDDNEKFVANEDGSDSDTHSYSDMVNSTKGWEVIDNGGINWFWGIDNNAIVKAPNGEQIRLDNLLDKLVSEGMDKKAAKEAIKALQKNLKIVG